MLRQGSQSILDYYNAMNQKLTLLINKTIMARGTNTSITNELNKKNRNNALRVFITGLITTEPHLQCNIIKIGITIII